MYYHEKEGPYMHATERLIKIVEIVENKGFVSVDDLVAMLNVSPMTVRRDLALLENQGNVSRVHGGVVSLQYNVEKPFHTRALLNADEKSSVANRAVSIIEGGDVIYLGSGTTVGQMASSLARSTGITIVTPSFPIVEKLVDREGITLIFLGGIVKPDTYCTAGQTVEKQLSQYHFNKTFIGTSGILFESGVYNSDILISSFEKMAIAQSDEVYVITDHTKLGTGSLVHILPPEEVTALILDPTKITEEHQHQLNENRWRVIQA